MLQKIIELSQAYRLRQCQSRRHGRQSSPEILRDILTIVLFFLSMRDRAIVSQVNRELLYLSQHHPSPYMCVVFNRLPSGEIGNTVFDPTDPLQEFKNNNSLVPKLKHNITHLDQKCRIIIFGDVFYSYSNQNLFRYAVAGNHDQGSWQKRQFRAGVAEKLASGNPYSLHALDPHHLLLLREDETGEVHVFSSLEAIDIVDEAESKADGDENQSVENAIIPAVPTPRSVLLMALCTTNMVEFGLSLLAVCRFHRQVKAGVASPAVLKHIVSETTCGKHGIPIMLWSKRNRSLIVRWCLAMRCC